MLLTACAASLPVRDFRTDYDRARSRQSVTVAGYPPFRVLELREQRRIKVEVNVLHQAFGGLVDPLILLSITDGIPPLSAHQAAAQAYLAETWRQGCTVEPRRGHAERRAPTNSVIPVRTARNRLANDRAVFDEGCRAFCLPPAAPAHMSVRAGTGPILETSQSRDDHVFGEVPAEGPLRA